MLNRYFIRPTTVDRIRASWVGDAIERYVGWLDEQNYAARNVFVRVPILMRFGDFARRFGAHTLDELPAHVEPFIEDWLKRRKLGQSECERRITAQRVRNPIHQLLRLILPHHGSNSPGKPNPFVDKVPGFFDFLRRDRGLRDATIVQYRHYLGRLEDDLRKADCSLSDLSPAVISAFITESGKAMDKRSVQSLCSILKTFFRYLYRIGLVTCDLSEAIESPRRYRLTDLPRSIAWCEVEQMLGKVDRRNPVGQRDYAILLLLVTYGLRAREVAALTLNDVDWKRDRLHVRGRKAGHSTAYPLAAAVGEAILDYLQIGRPKTTERALFFRAFAPYTPISGVAVSLRAKFYSAKAGSTCRGPARTH